MITIQELLYNRGLNRNARIKLVRHKQRGIDLYNMYRSDIKAFLDYQSDQSKDVFSGVDYIVSFIGESGMSARFVGVFQIFGKEKTNTHFKYSMKEVEGYEDLKEKVIIRWSNAISWHQWIKNEMEVLEITPGLRYKRFTDYLELILSYQELKEIVVNQYQDWKAILSLVKGVYLISDARTGLLYVGSAYGEDGIWGRWSDYVFTGGHGGNKALKNLTEHFPGYADNFRFSILMLLPKTITPEEAIKKELLFKEKLGTNSFGLNSN